MSIDVQDMVYREEISPQIYPMGTPPCQELMQEEYEGNEDGIPAPALQ
jgi:hypothetical protein